MREPAVSLKRLILPAESRRRILSHVWHSKPKEAVGLLAGSGTERVSHVLPLKNIARGNMAFLADPLDQFQAMHCLNAENLRLLAIYHSHPDGGDAPSEDDLIYAKQWSCVHLIVAFNTQSGSRVKCRAFRFDQLGKVESVMIKSE